MLLSTRDRETLISHYIVIVKTFMRSEVFNYLVQHHAIDGTWIETGVIDLSLGIFLKKSKRMI